MCSKSNDEHIRYTFVAQVLCQQEYWVNPVLGERYYLHWAGTGKAILAFSSKHEIQGICSLLAVTAATGNTSREPQQLLEQTNEIKNMDLRIVVLKE